MKHFFSVALALIAVMAACNCSYGQTNKEQALSKAREDEAHRFYRAQY